MKRRAAHLRRRTAVVASEVAARGETRRRRVSDYFAQRPGAATDSLSRAFALVITIRWDWTAPPSP